MRARAWPDADIACNAAALTRLHACIVLRPAQVLGHAAFGVMQRAFYDLLRRRHAPKREALFATLRDLVTKFNAMLPGNKRMCVSGCVHACALPMLTRCAAVRCRVYTFVPETVTVAPTRVEAALGGGGGFELIADAFARRVDFNQTGLTLHQLMQDDDDADGDADPPASQQGSQGAPAAAGPTTAPVDIAYANIRSIKRGAAAMR